MTKGKEEKQEKKPRKPRASGNALLVNKAIKAFANKLDEKNVTVGEFVRLLEIQKQMGADEPKDITVTWVEQGESEKATDK